jgi:hypothetical protein
MLCEWVRTTCKKSGSWDDVQMTRPFLKIVMQNRTMYEATFSLRCEERVNHSHIREDSDQGDHFQALALAAPATFPS